MSATLNDPVRLTDDDSAIASVAVRALARVESQEEPIELRLGTGEDAEVVVLPPDAVRLFVRALAQLANGRAVTLAPVDAELTTQQAAELLNVSRPYVVSLLERGELPHRKVGSRRRVRLEDVLAYRERSQRRSREAVDELARESQVFGLYDG
jgi:excisionase family DNA binding protein